MGELELMSLVMLREIVSCLRMEITRSVRMARLERIVGPLSVAVSLLNAITFVLEIDILPHCLKTDLNFILKIIWLDKILKI